jgi:hypothetical protein
MLLGGKGQMLSNAGGGEHKITGRFRRPMTRRTFLDFANLSRYHLNWHSLQSLAHTNFTRPSTLDPIVRAMAKRFLHYRILSTPHDFYQNIPESRSFSALCQLVGEYLLAPCSHEIECQAKPVLYTPVMPRL